jgi:type II secretion system protein G
MKYRKSAGFTLIEILAVLSIIIVIMGLSVGLVAVVNQKNTQARAHKDLAKIQEAVETWKKLNGRYPADQPTASYVLPQTIYQHLELKYQEFNDADNVPIRRYVDPWGIEYRYIKKSEYEVLIGTFGRDRAPGAEDVNDDDDDDKSNNDVDELGYGDDLTTDAR